jgi:HD-GYP domain-containing protein (c-di-GMP phosphodiesterase class II)
VDAFDAMISQRPYSAPCSAEYAVTELKRGAGTHFDTNVVSILDTIISKTSTGGAASVAADCVAVA